MQLTHSSVKHAGGSVNGTGTLTFIDDFTAGEVTGWMWSYGIQEHFVSIMSANNSNN